MRLLGPKDVNYELEKLLAGHGFTPTGPSRPEKGFNDRERVYLIAPVNEFRSRHHLFAGREMEHLEKANATEAATIAAYKSAVPELISRQQLIGEEIAKRDSTIEALKGKPDEIVAISKAKEERVQLVEAERLINWDLRNKNATIAQEPELAECQRKLALVKTAKENLKSCPVCKGPGALASGVQNPVFDTEERTRGWRTPGRSWWLDLSCSNPDCRARYSQTLGEAPKPKAKSKQPAHSEPQIFGAPTREEEEAL